MKNRSIRVVVGVFLAAAAGAAAAADLDQLQRLGQSAFRSLTEDLGAALSYKSLSPATPLGVTGFDVGVDASFTRLHTNAFGVASNSSKTTLPIARLRVQKGLPFNIDAGISFTELPGTNMRLWGGELRYAILPGSVATPAVAVRGTYSKLTGVNQLDFDTKSIDVSVSKGVLGVTPYGGVGYVWASGTPRNVPGLSSETAGLGKAFVGVNIGLALFATGVEYDRTGQSNTLSIKAALRW